MQQVREQHERVASMADRSERVESTLRQERDVIQKKFNEKVIEEFRSNGGIDRDRVRIDGGGFITRGLRSNQTD